MRLTTSMISQRRCASSDCFCMNGSDLRMNRLRTTANCFSVYHDFAPAAKPPQGAADAQHGTCHLGAGGATGPAGVQSGICSRMRRIETKVRTADPEFAENRHYHEALAGELRARLREVQAGGPEELRRRHKQRGKLLARERIDALIDPDTPFLELSPLAAYDMYDHGAPGAGIITGIGTVSGRQTVIVANDATVKGGTYFPMTVKKHLR